MIEDKKEFAALRVAVVDDNRAFRDILRVMLRGFGFRRVDLFGDAAETIPFLCQNHVDLLFVDLMMPYMDGIDLTRELRHGRTVVNRHMPIIMVTGHASRATVMAAVAAGIDDILVKPVSPRTVFDRIKLQLRSKSRYVAGEGNYFGPNVAERWRSMERRLIADKWRIVKPDRARPPVRVLELPEAKPAAPKAPGWSGPVPGFNVPVRGNDPDAFLLD